MADEIFAQIKLIHDYKLATPIINKDITWRDDALAGPRHNKIVQPVTFGVWQALEIGDLVKQWMLIENLDKTNYVFLGKNVADATEFCRIPAGTAMLIYMIAATPAVNCDTANCDIEISGVEGSS